MDDEAIPATPLLLMLVPGRMKMPLRYVDVPVVILSPTFDSRAAWLCYSAAIAVGDRVERDVEAGTLPGGEVISSTLLETAVHGGAGGMHSPSSEWFSAAPGRVPGAIGDECVEVMTALLCDTAVRYGHSSALAGDMYGAGPSIARRASFCLSLWLQARAAEARPRVVPAVLKPFEAGWPLATALWVCVDVLEKSRLYLAAIKALEQLLACPYTPHRRGRWYNRLSIDLCHMVDNAGAARVCERGVRDQLVSAGDRVTLARRGAKLRRSFEAHADVVNVDSDAESDVDGDGEATKGFSGASGTAASDRPMSISVVVPGVAVASTPYSGVIHEHALRARGGQPTPTDVVVTDMVARPLNREVGKKSRFISARDSFNGAGGDAAAADAAAIGCAAARDSFFQDCHCHCLVTWDVDDYLTDFGIRGMPREDAAFRISVEQLALDHYRHVVCLWF